jgi:2-polyprenyl-6-methoxyphenol hydroxylase-like FAD-dependent oxidoreductase
MRILISGAGIAGPTLAYWLVRHGFEVTLVEKAPALRTGGYIIDFWGAGFDVADRMGIVPELVERGYRVQEVRVVGDDGRRVSGFDASVFDRFTAGRFTSLPRGELAATIYARIEREVETLFGDSIRALTGHGDRVHVELASGAARDFDLVIGADGLHSEVRALAFGPESAFERYLGYSVAAFESAGYRPRDEDVYIMHTEVGRQIGRFSMRGDRTMFLFVFADPAGAGEELHDPAAQKARLRRRFADSRWRETRAILERLDACDSLYFDRVSQIRLDAWSQGRVALVGDAAFCVSLLAGQGSALAMVSAYVLAGELHAAAGNHEVAFARYRERLAPMIAEKQRAAVRFAGSFAPRSTLQLFLRNQVMKLLSIGVVARAAIGRGLRDTIELPAY